MKKKASAKSVTKKVANPAKKAVTKKVAAKKSATKKASTKKVAAKKVATKKAATKKVAAKKAVTKKTATAKASANGGSARKANAASALTKRPEIVTPPQDQIRILAYFGWCDRKANGKPGDELGDWVAAERFVAEQTRL